MRKKTRRRKGEGSGKESEEEGSERVGRVSGREEVVRRNCRGGVRAERGIKEMTKQRVDINFGKVPPTYQDKGK